MKFRPGWLAIAFVTGFLAVGIPYWLIPHANLGLPGDLMAPGGLVVAIAPLILRASGAARFWKAVLVVGAAVPAVVFARVVMDGLADPTSHNLWPLEVIIALGLGLPCALAGAIAGSLLARLVKGPTPERHA